MVPLVFFAALSLATIGSSLAETYCDNNCQPASSTEGKYFCVLSNPTKYTVCVNGIRNEFSCSSGLVFDLALNVCNWPSAAAPCQCGVGPDPPTPDPVKTTPKNPATQTPGKTDPPIPPGTMKKVCYYTNWAQYRQGGGSFKPENLDPTLCTYIIYAFLKFDANSITLQEWNDDVMIPRLLALKSQNPSLKVIASIGGWNAGTFTFHQIIQTASSRSTFNRAAISFVRQYNFDGLDIDFEYPGDESRGSPKSDRPLFTAWMQSLASDFAAEAKTSGKPRLLLGAAVAAGKSKIDDGYDVPAVSAALDFISVMCYDFHGTWETVTGYNAPLYKMASWPSGSEMDMMTTSYSVNYWLSKGAPASKIMMGIPTYGHVWRLANGANNGIGAPATGPGDRGKYTGEAGFDAYYETCMLSKCTSQPYTYIYNTELQGPYMYYGTNWISTEDQASVKAKAEFAKSKGLGGVMYWAIDLDDFSDMCQNGVKYPLVKTVNSILAGVQPPTLNHGNKGPQFC